jgi:predicted dehydrogenase
MRHVDQLLDMEGQAVIDTVVDNNQDHIQALQDKHGAVLGEVEFASDWEMVFDEEHRHIDAVISCMPDRYHIDIATAAIGKGKHLLGEKPLATTLDEYAQLKHLFAKSEAEGLVFLPCNPRETAGVWSEFRNFGRDKSLLADHFGRIGNAAIGDVGDIKSLRTLIHYAAPREGDRGHTSAAADKLNHEITTLCRLTDVEGFERAFLLDNQINQYSASLMTTSGIWLTTQALRVGTRHKNRDDNMYHESAEIVFDNGALSFDASSGTMTLRYGERPIHDRDPSRYGKSARRSIGAMTRHFLARIRGEEADRFGANADYLTRTALLSTLASLMLEEADSQGIPIRV